jgi:hypothetical protein
MAFWISATVLMLLAYYDNSILSHRVKNAAVIKPQRQTRSQKSSLMFKLTVARLSDPRGIETSLVEPLAVVFAFNQNFVAHFVEAAAQACADAVFESLGGALACAPIHR